MRTALTRPTQPWLRIKITTTPFWWTVGPPRIFGYPKDLGYNDWRFDPATGAFSSERAGPNNPTFGLRWSPTNNERQPSSVTTTIELSYTAPFFPFMDPWEEQETSTGGIGNVANGAHVVNFFGSDVKALRRH